MNFGKDFWFIIKLLHMFIKVLAELGKEENGDTPKGEV